MLKLGSMKTIQAMTRPTRDKGPPKKHSAQGVKGQGRCTAVHPASAGGNSRRHSGCVGLGSQRSELQAPGAHSCDGGELWDSGHFRLPASQRHSGPGQGTSTRQIADPPWKSVHHLPGRPPWPPAASASPGAPGSTPALWESGACER